MAARRSVRAINALELEQSESVFVELVLGGSDVAERERHLRRALDVAVSERDVHDGVDHDAAESPLRVGLERDRALALHLGTVAAAAELSAATAAATRRSERNVEIRQRPAPLKPRLSEAEAADHRTFVESLGPGALWNDYRTGD